MLETLNAPEIVSPPFLDIDAQTFRENFNRRPFLIGHHLSDHPLFALPRLIELAQRLPEGRVEYNAGSLPVSQNPSSTPRNGLSITETIRRIEQCRSWMVLKNVELDLAYRDLLDDCLDVVRKHTQQNWPGMHRREGFIFISSPGSVTPFHIDPENNFLLQIRGSKEVQLFDAGDRAVLPESDIEAFFAGAHRNLVYKEEYRDRGQTFELTPGLGLHFPVIAPHWVKNGPEVSISFSVTFRTNASDSRDALYRLNHTLRRWHLRPTPVGQSAFCDGLKMSAIRVARVFKHLVPKRKAEKTPGRMGM